MIFRSFNPHNWLRHETFKSHTFKACKWPRQEKIKNLHTNFLAKNKPVELTYHKAGLLVQYPQKNQAKKVMKFRVLKVESAYSTMSGKSKFSWLIYDFSNNVNYVVRCLQKGRPRCCWQNRICYCKISLNVKVLFFLIKVWNMKNVSIWFQQKPQLIMFCLIQGINNHEQINTY